MDIEIIEVSPQKVIGMTRKGKYEIIAQLIPELCKYAIEKGAQISAPPVFLCHESSAEDAKKANAEGSAMVEIVVPVSREIGGTDAIGYYELPGGKLAKIIHKGPYQDGEPAYAKLFAWLEQNQKTVIGPIREIYMNDPREVPPEEMITEIYAPIG